MRLRLPRAFAFLRGVCAFRLGPCLARPSPPPSPIRPRTPMFASGWTPRPQPQRASQTAAAARSWPGEVRVLGARLLHDFGPFVVRGDAGTGTESAGRPRFPLFRLNGVLDAVLRSEPMASSVPSVEAAYGYVLWCSRRLGAEAASPAQATAAAATARRHGVAEPLFLSLPKAHAWASDRAWIADFLAGEPAARARGFDPPSASPKAVAARKRRVPSAVRVALWNAWHGREAGVGECHCCGCAVTQQDFEAGHVVAAAHGGAARLDNLRVLCRPCNRSMGSRDMRAFIAEHFAAGQKDTVARRALARPAHPDAAKADDMDVDVRV